MVAYQLCRIGSLINFHALINTLFLISSGPGALSPVAGPPYRAVWSASWPSPGDRDKSVCQNLERLQWRVLSIRLRVTCGCLVYLVSIYRDLPVCKSLKYYQRRLFNLFVWLAPFRLLWLLTRFLTIRSFCHTKFPSNLFDFFMR
jgi:hypothetical protein